VKRKYQLRINELGDGFHLIAEDLSPGGVFYHRESDAIQYAKSKSPDGFQVSFLDRWGQLIRTEEY
jgi:hypothetical protein